MTLRWPKALAWLLLALLVVVLSAWFVLLRPIPQPHVNDPIQSFNHGSIGNEESCQGPREKEDQHHDAQHEK